MKHSRSLRKKLMTVNLIIFVPIVIMFLCGIFFMNRFVTNDQIEDRMNRLSQQVSVITTCNEEIYNIINHVAVDFDVNRVISQKKKAQGRELISNNQEIQKATAVINELYYGRDYKLALICENGILYLHNGALYQSEDAGDIINSDWYQKLLSDDVNSVRFLSHQEATVLSNYYDDDTIFVTRIARNVMSGRVLGVVSIPFHARLWMEDIEQYHDNPCYVIDQEGKIITSVNTASDQLDVREWQSLSEIIGNKSGNTIEKIQDKAYRIFFMEISGTDWKLVMLEDKHSFSSLITLLTVIFAISVLTLLVILIMFNSSLIQKRVSVINESIERVAEGNLKVRIRGDYETEFMTICNNFNDMLDRLEALMLKLEQEEEEKYLLEFRSLQSQIGSHFIYNTLASIRFMIEMEEYEAADQTLILFSKLLRNRFADMRRIIPLREEIDITEEYLEMMNLRMRGRCTWDIHLPADIENRGILKNTLQPIVENSLMHGFNEKEGDGRIIINVTADENKTIIDVSDNGVGTDVDKLNANIIQADYSLKKDRFSEIGLSNIEQRIRHNFGDQYGLNARTNEFGGITIRMVIPDVDMSEVTG